MRALISGLCLLFLSTLLYPVNVPFIGYLPWFVVISVFFITVITLLKAKEPLQLDFLSRSLLFFGAYASLNNLVQTFLWQRFSPEYMSISQEMVSNFLKPMMPFLLVSSVSQVKWERVPNKYKNLMEIIIFLGAFICGIFAIIQFLPYKPTFIVSLLKYFIPPSMYEYFFDLPSAIGYKPRVVGTVGNPNVLGAFSCLFILFLLYPMTEKKNRFSRRLLIYFMIVLYLIVTFLCQSRSAIIALCTVFLVNFLLIPKKRYKAVIILAIITFVLLRYSYQLPYLKYFLTHGFNVRSFTARHELNLMVFSILKDNPGYLPFGGGLSFARQFGVEGDIGTLDNEYIRVLAAYGIIGVFFFLLVFWSAIKIAKDKFTATSASRAFVFGSVFFIVVFCYTAEILSNNRGSILYFLLLSLILYKALPAEKSTGIWSRATKS